MTTIPVASIDSAETNTTGRLMGTAIVWRTPQKRGSPQVVAKDILEITYASRRQPH